jgi:hypothetical protein
MILNEFLTINYRCKINSLDYIEFLHFILREYLPICYARVNINQLIYINVHYLLRVFKHKFLTVGFKID